MKVVVLGTAHPFRGGIAVFIERLTRAFHANSDQASISTFTLQYPKILFPGKTQLSSAKKPHDIHIVEEVNSINPFSWLKVGSRLKKEKPDVIILKYWIPFMAPCFGTISRIAKKNGHTKVIVIVDNIIPHEKRVGDNWLNNYFVNSVDGFVAMSDNVLNDLMTFDKVKPKLLSPHPLYDNFGAIKARNEAIKTLGLDTTCRYLLFFGIIRKYKGLDILLKAFADSRIDKTNLKLIVAGEFYEDSNPYLSLIDELNLGDAVVLANHFIPDDQVVDYFCAADMVVQPYKNATQSGVTQIAYHFDTPMLVTDVGGLKEIVPHNKVGYVVQSDHEEVADALVDFYQNSRLNEFISGVKDEKRKYTWQTMVDSIHKIHKTLRANAANNA